MLSAAQQKFLTALQVKKYRQMYLKFIVEGEKMVAELLSQQRIKVAAIYGLETWAESQGDILTPFLDKFNPVSAAELKKISALTTPNAVLAVAEIPDEPLDSNALTQGFHFYLDGIQDPGNMGTILRIADWFGFSHVFASPDCVDVFSPKVVQACMGAVFRVPCLEIPLFDLCEMAPAIPVLGAVLNGEPVFSDTLPQRGILVIGNEGKGIRPDTEALLSHRITIPRPPQGRAESLNAAVAAGIIAAALTVR